MHELLLMIRTWERVSQGLYGISLSSLLFSQVNISFKLQTIKFFTASSKNHFVGNLLQMIMQMEFWWISLNSQSEILFAAMWLR